MNGETNVEMAVEPVETKWIPVDEIEPHPDALAFWRGDEEDDEDENTSAGQDAGALKNSVARHGNFEAALVTRKEDDSGWWLLDGCGRLAGAMQGGRDKLYCTVLEIAPADFGKLMMEVNMNRHRVATPSRVLRYLELYQEQVLAAAKENADASATGSRGGRGKVCFRGVGQDGRGAVSVGTGFSVEAIRERLHCRKQEVVGGILLLKCRREGAVPYMDARNKWQLRPATEDELEKRDKIVERIRKGVGSANLSRWAQGLDGMLKTEGKPRAQTNYYDCGSRGITSLKTAFSHWFELNGRQRDLLMRLLRDLVADHAPEEVRVMLAKMFESAE